ncbi:transmembrane protein 138 isoform X1 [Corvus cornix cornix]|uniref:transmembrane protein 138 isoform X1 n=1 Tax=Corvus cornix cornix TaxID=932674 RepID=UPI0019523B19|nr:transmembrane protein 138 isoform X1 [Corvus cornix cornix]
MSRHPQISCLAGHRHRKRVETRGPMVPRNLGHRDSWISQIWDTRCHGSPKSGNTWLHSSPKPEAPLDLGTQRAAPTPPKPQTRKCLGLSRPRSRPPPPAPTPGPYLGPSAPSSSLGAAILAGAALPAHLYGFPRPLQCATTEGSGGQSGPRGSSSFRFRPDFRLRRQLPWGPRWRWRVRGVGRGPAEPPRSAMIRWECWG